MFYIYIYNNEILNTWRRYTIYIYIKQRDIKAEETLRQKTLRKPSAATLAIRGRNKKKELHQNNEKARKD
jgi:hypothetical protein